MPHLHLSIQAGDDLTLKRMKRRHSRADTIAFCRTVRDLRPDIVFGADLIAGFPTETQAMFEQTLSIIDDCGLTFLHVFPFSPREETPAARMPQLERGLVKARAKALRDKGDAAVSAHLAAQVGRASPVLMETAMQGRTPQFAPVRFAAPGAEGAIVAARLTGHDGTRLEGMALQ